MDWAVPYLLGPVLGLVLRLRGLVPLHASAISVGGRAVALLGPGKAGKSTTAAVFARLGYPVLSDDVVVLWDHGDTFLVPPAYPRLCLWPEAVQSLYGSADALPLITPDWDKHYLDLTDNGCRFQSHPLPLAAIYVLGGRSSSERAPFVEPLCGQSSLMALLTNTYVSYLLDKPMRAREFELLGRLMSRVPLRRAHPHRDPAYIRRFCEVILDDWQALQTPAPTLPAEHRD